jgi:hypothetical protein
MAMAANAGPIAMVSRPMVKLPVLSRMLPMQVRPCALDRPSVLNDQSGGSVFAASASFLRRRKLRALNGSMPM